MALYSIEWKRSAAKDFKDLPKDVISRILDAVEQLAADPSPHGAKKLLGSEHTYRIRQGSYRIVYTVSKATLVVEITRIGHRKDVYDR
jgi:mRNA interferase RelE/StbE